MRQLPPGSLIDCFAPSVKPPDAGANEGAKKFLESMGWRMRCPSDVYNKNDLYANTREFRAQATASAIIAGDSRCMWALKGGYGASAILPAVHGLLKGCRVSPKLLIGFSDITALHMYLINEYNWSTLHWEQLERIGRGLVRTEAVRIFECMAGGTTKSLRYYIEPLNKAAREVTVLSSRIFGGNLSVMSYSVGTFWGRTPDDFIMFLEDVNEGAHYIDASLEWLRQAGYFDRARAVILGSFNCDSCVNPVRERELSRIVIALFADKINIPVFKMDKIGHIPYNRPLPLNTKTEISGMEDGQHMLEVDTGMS